MADYKGLTRTQRKAMAALLAERSVRAAAVAAGIPERTLFRYLGNKEFRSALTAAESDSIDEAGRRLLAGQAQALDALEKIILGSEKDSDKRLAAQAWLDLALRWRELRNTEERIDALEKRVFGD